MLASTKPPWPRHNYPQSTAIQMRAQSGTGGAGGGNGTRCSRERAWGQCGSWGGGGSDPLTCRLGPERPLCWLCRWVNASLRTLAILAWCLLSWMRSSVSSSGWERSRENTSLSLATWTATLHCCGQRLLVKEYVKELKTLITEPLVFCDFYMFVLFV